MSSSLQFFRLIRPYNLIMILFTQYMIRFAFLYPVLKMGNFHLQVSEAVYFVFCLAFVFMAAGGYIINDMSDIRIDRINKPERIIIGKGISLERAQRFYWFCSIIGIAFGFYASYRIGLPGLGLLFFIYLSGLWFYSTSLKYMFLVGNVVIALFLALVPFTAGLIELYKDVSNLDFANTGIDQKFLLYSVTGISIFAFLVNLAREIVKDIEDIEGDSAVGCRTVPIVWGVKPAKAFVWVIMGLILAGLLWFGYKAYQVKDWYTLVYSIVLIDIPVLLIMRDIGKANAKEEFHKVSSRIKWLMVSGISYLFVFAYVILHGI